MRTRRRIRAWNVSIPFSTRAPSSGLSLRSISTAKPSMAANTTTPITEVERVPARSAKMLVGTNDCSSDGMLRLATSPTRASSETPFSSSRAPRTSPSARRPNKVVTAMPMTAATAVVAMSTPSTPALILPSERVSFNLVTADRIEMSTSGEMIICSRRT